MASTITLTANKLDEFIGKSIEDGEHLVEIQVRNQNQSGLATALGTAIVALPSRDVG